MPGRIRSINAKFYTPEQEDFLVRNYGKLPIGKLTDGVSALQSGYRTKKGIYKKIERLKERGLIHDQKNEALEISKRSGANRKAK